MKAASPRANPLNHKRSHRISSSGSGPLDKALRAEMQRWGQPPRTVGKTSLQGSQQPNNKARASANTGASTRSGLPGPVNFNSEVLVVAQTPMAREDVGDTLPCGPGVARS